MNKIIKTIVYLGALAGLFVGTAVFAGPGTPLMSTSPILAGSLTTTSVIVNGYYQNSPDRVWFEYGTSTQFGATSAQQSTTSVQSQMSATLSGLTPNTLYYYRAVGENASGIGYGTPIRTFRTLSVPVVNNPSVVSTYTANVSYTSATLYGVVNANGNANQTATISYNGNTLVSQTVSGNSNVSLSAPLSGLTAGTTYSFTVCIGSVCQTASFSTLNQNTTSYACNDGYDNDGDGRTDMNDSGCASSSDNDEYNQTNNTYACNDGYDNDGDGYTDMNDTGCSSYYDTDEYNFVNNYIQPSVTTYAATNVQVNGTTATLNGYVASNGGSASRYFQYGTNQYSLTNSTSTIYLGNTSVNVSENVTNLQPNTTYYFRLVGQNSNGSGVVYGQTLSFTTGTTGTSTNVLTTPAVVLSQTSMKINGLVINNTNTPTTAWFEWGSNAFSLTNSTNQQSLGNVSSVTFTDTITGLTKDSVYYFRAVSQGTNGVISKGEILFAKTLGNGGTTTVIIPSTTTNNTTITSGGTVRNSYIALSLKTAYETVAIGDTVDYTLTYKNITTDKTLNKVVLRVVFPKAITFVRSSQGVYNEADSTLTVEVGTLVSSQEGIVSFQGTVNRFANPGDLLVVTAAIVYTDNANQAQGDAIAYVSNRVVGGDNGLLAAAIFGYGFLPTTFLGWLLLILLIILLVYFARKLYKQGEGHHEHVKPPAHN